MDHLNSTVQPISGSLTLRAILDRVTKELDEGKAVDIDSYATQYPEHADELRELLPTLCALVDLGFADEERCRSLSAVDVKNQSPTDGVLGDFRILRELGRGGMGIVYEAEEISLRRRVALKVLPFGALLDKRQLERFQNEARVIARLKHPNLVSVYSVGCERAVHYYAMELVDGKSLAQVIGQLTQPNSCDPPATANDRADDTQALAQLSTEYFRHPQRYFRSAARLILQAAEALHYAHEQGVIHRDIKPSNLLIDENGKLWVADFGLAAIQTEHTLTVTGDLLGTLRYMSPEQASGNSLADPRIDVYALGVTLYELLTLQSAFAGTDHQSLLQDVIHRHPRHPRQLNPAIPVDLETTILKSTAKEPGARYQSAKELAEDLHRFLEHKPIKARRATHLENVRRWARRNPTVAALSTVLLAMLVFLAIAGPLVAIRQTSLAEASVKSGNELRLRLYRSDVDSAYFAYHSHDVATSRRLLERHEPRPDEQDHREFSWHYLTGLHRKIEFQPVLRCEGTVYGLEFLQDGTLVTSSSSGVALWNLGQRELIHKIVRGRRNSASASIAISPDEQFLATCCASRTQVWRVSDGQCVQTFEDDSCAPLVVRFAPNGQELVLAGHQGTLGIFDLIKSQWRPFPTANEELVRTAVFSPDGRSLAMCAEDRVLRVWDVATKEVKYEEDLPKCADGVVFSPDGRFVFHDGLSNAVGMVDLVESISRSLFACPLVNGYPSLAISPQGRVLAAVGDDNTVRIWNLESSRLVGALVGHASTITSAAFSADGRILATGSKNGTVRLWEDFGSVAPSEPSRYQAVETSIAISPQQRILAVGWGPRSMRTGSGGIRLWHLDTLQPLDLPIQSDLESPVFDVAFSPVAPLLASGGGRRHIDGEVKLRNVANNTYSNVCQEYTDAVYAVAFSPDGRTLAAAGKASSRTVRLWDTATGELRHEFDPLPLLNDLTPDIMSIAFSPSGSILAAGGGRWDADRGVIRLWDAHNFAELATVYLDDERVSELVFFPDGERLAISSDSGTVTLYELSSRRKDRLFTSGLKATAIAISPDGRTLAIGSTNNGVRLWHTEAGGQVGVLPVPHPVKSVLFTPDGLTLIAACDNKSVWIWRTAPAPAVSSLVVLNSGEDQSDVQTRN